MRIEVGTRIAAMGGGRETGEVGESEFGYVEMLTIDRVTMTQAISGTLRFRRDVGEYGQVHLFSQSTEYVRRPMYWLAESDYARVQSFIVRLRAIRWHILPIEAIEAIEAIAGHLVDGYPE